ncbi:NAD(P)H-hydrate dehydratase [Alicyclobacillus fastidiosus]|uniref:Bifunctional NAD(P)H-hydrate repair enzyme n=1 Tax=Alicyclobacillus fastidiosus TaxID=392011 RepID=A0ABY6ZFI7_9BACL|nr:NAD(P)H-hydrate dehydratase [Alicyclobacillus fastidiosus]WAH41674.1 NAD(P)H-hydrate dehydratase [Alicyclobacillus fastidiosus]GMA63354.1 bifunctional NAD(P)H-hydrate repair enzyme Nnr [Alicyclobacillus fastidiosus]
MYLVTSEQMRCFDHDTIETLKVPGIVLMDHAGKAVAQIVRERRVKSVCIACGKGNNGGDGWLAARWLRHFGVQVRVVCAQDPDSTLQGDARQAFDMARAAGVTWTVYRAGSFHDDTCELIVDALLGTGTARPLAGVYREMVEEMNAANRPTISVDIPSGVNASTGEVYGVAVEASETVAMAFEKLGTAVTPGALYAGHVHVVDIGIPAPLPEGLATYVHPAVLRAKWGTREAMSHKGSYGRCGIYVGQMQGASMLAAAGAARAGAGLVILVTGGPLSHAPAPDYVVRTDTRPACALTDCTSIVYGPGLGEAREDLVRHLVNEADDTSARVPCVIDADGLKGLQRDGGLLTIGDRFVLTPHPKECAALLGWTTAEVQARRLAAAKQLAAQTGAVVLLKGYRTIIATSNGSVRVNPTGNASLAVGGSGDVLAGVIGGLLAQGLEPFDAASLGAWLHGRAGELAGAALTPVSTTASDVVDYISRAIMTLFDRADVGP